MVRLAKLAYPLAILLIVATSGEVALAQSNAARKHNNSTFHPKGIQGQGGADWLAPLFGSQARYRSITGTGLQQLNELDKSKQKLTDELGTLEPTHPTGRRHRGR